MPLPDPPILARSAAAATAAALSASTSSILRFFFEVFLLFLFAEQSGEAEALDPHRQDHPRCSCNEPSLKPTRITATDKEQLPTDTREAWPQSILAGLALSKSVNCPTAKQTHCPN